MKQEHYFTQESINPSEYFDISGTIGKLKLNMQSAPGVFAAKRFDTGTVVLLKALTLDETIGNLRVLDLGAGYGLVSVYLAQQLLDKKLPRLSALHVDAVDISSLAVDLTQQNLKDHYSKRLSYKTICADGLSSQYFEDVRYDMIITNPPFSAGKQKVHKLIEQAYEHLRVGGVMRIVVPTKRGAKSYIKRSQELFGNESVDFQTVESGFRVWTITKIS